VSAIIVHFESIKGATSKNMTSGPVLLFIYMDLALLMSRIYRSKIEIKVLTEEKKLM